MAEVGCRRWPGPARVPVARRRPRARTVARASRAARAARFQAAAGRARRQLCRAREPARVRLFAGRGVRHGTASIQRVMGSRKTPSVPVRKIAHSSQPQLRPHQVCSQDMLCRKPGFTSFPANGPNGGGASAHSAAQRQHHVARFAVVVASADLAHHAVVVLVEHVGHVQRQAPVLVDAIPARRSHTARPGAPMRTDVSS